MSGANDHSKGGADLIGEVDLFQPRLSRPRIISDLTLVVAFDAKYVAKLRQSWPTWKRFRPWFRQLPVLLVHDAAFDLAGADLDFLGDHPDIRFISWSMPNAESQRERMLTSLVHVPAEQVQTTWYLKLDADTYATKVTKWIYDEWFDPMDCGSCPAYVASPWGYTKPANAIAKLDIWGDSIDGLRNMPRLNLRVQKGSSLVRHSRMISQVFFGNTAWTSHVAKFAAGRLPCPSQDTYLSYCAARLNSPTRQIKMAQYGWAHASSQSRLTAACTDVLSNNDDRACKWRESRRSGESKVT